MSSLDAATLFGVQGLVVAITGGGSGKWGNLSEYRNLTSLQESDS